MVAEGGRPGVWEIGVPRFPITVLSNTVLSNTVREIIRAVVIVHTVRVIGTITVVRSVLRLLRGVLDEHAPRAVAAPA
jgi:hypothetical protein